MIRRRLLEGGVGRGQMSPNQASISTPGNTSADGNSPETGTVYIMRQRMISFGDDFFIQDAEGRPKYKVDGKVLRVRDTLKFRNMEGDVLLHLQEQLVRARESLSIMRGNQVAARVHNAVFDPLRERFQIEIPGGQDMVTMGKIIWAEYTVQRNEKLVARVTKGFSWIGRDQYGVQIASGEDDILILAITVCLDMLVHEGR